MKLIILCILIAIPACKLSADDNSARRYVFLQSDPIISKYFLLSQRPVQKELNLTELQIRSLESAMQESPTSIVAIAELRRSQKVLLKAANSDAERAKIRRESNEKAQLLIHENWEIVLQNILSQNQIEILGELLLQMKGPHAILEDSNLVIKLELSPLQVNQLQQISDKYAQFFHLLYNRYLGLQLSPIRRRDEADLSREIESLALVIKQTGMDQDSELLAVLKSDQRLKWNNLCGSPISINWGLESFADVPFEKAANNP